MSNIFFLNRIHKQLLIFLIGSIFFNLAFCQYAPLEKSKVDPIKEYITTFREGKLLPKRKFTKSENPKISIIIPMFNEEKNILSVIRSVQNQNLQDIEIVCVNDNSNDNTLSILNKLKKEDPRITIITNKINRGVLYNRIYGAQESKGEYVTFINANDGFSSPEILEKAYDIATNKYKEKIEVVHYQTCGSQIDNDGKMGNFVIFDTFIQENFDKIIRQSELGDNYFQKGKNITGSGLVFDKLYKKQLIKRAASYIGPHIWNQNLVYSYDFLLAYAIMKTAKSIVNIGDIGYWHLMNTKESSNTNVWDINGYKLKHPEKANKQIGDYILITERLLELTDNEPGSVEFREFILRKFGQERYMKAVARSNYYDKYLSLCDKFINWKYTDKEAKERLLNYVKFLLEFKVDPVKMFGYILEEDDDNDEDDDDDEYLINRPDEL